ncbi:MAG: tRNA lysidine(34) synthetase TilS [Bacteroidetes bacterium]|nr:tRNA lysidine(34) synthetase TilS [Bacteroidota bacterium]MBU1114025.1 tRNA lysidine(34) synthetase TilS [Bacteroidota bacterium]MBU1798959.1 tRNA lysidine(34) synthetase TilS [Bacteroidota bacterium]
MKGIVEQNIIRFISDHDLVKKSDRLLIAFSGGADSVSALHFFNKYKSKYGIEIFAMHINHSLRIDEADEDELFCKTFCEQLGVQFKAEKVDVIDFSKKNKESIEAAARNLRYFKLQEYATKIGATKIVTAHNLNDNTETLLLNLFRGTGLSGASGIPIKRENIIRPLLSTSKEDILNYVNANNIKFRVDSSNLKNDFSRNFLRNEIIPKLKEKINPALDSNLLKFSQIAKESNKIISKVAEDISKKYIIKTDLALEISDLLLLKMNSEIFNVAVRYTLEEKFKIVPTYKDISQIKFLFSLQVGSRVNLSERLSAIRERNFVKIYMENIFDNKIDNVELDLNKKVELQGKIFIAEAVENLESPFTNTKNVEYINGDKIIFPLSIRKWKAGDKFKPIGLNGTKKVSDFLTEAKVNSADKKNQMVVLNENKIIWIVNHRIDESVKINNETKRIIKLWVK